MGLRIVDLWKRVLAALERVEDAGPLLVRLSVGALFMSTGWGKLNNIEGVVEFFTTLGIPAPAFQARMVAFTEFTGGIALMAGLATRLAALPLAGTMIVAIATAKRDDIEGVTSFLALEEFTYFAALVWLIVNGAGALSLDAFIARRLRRRGTLSA